MTGDLTGSAVRETGLSDEEAGLLLAQDGPNELATGKRKSFVSFVWTVVREPMFLLLIACGVIYFVLGDKGEAAMLLVSLAVVMGITLYQERRSEQALEALRDLSSPRALVVRGGVQRRISGREVVRGDVVILTEGDRVPADALVLETTNLSVDESLLTGESVPVGKAVWDGSQTAGHPGGDGVPFVYSGTLVVQGRAVVRVTAIGPRSEIGRIGKALATLEVEGTLLQREIGRLVRLVASVAAVLCVGAVVLYGATRGHWLQGLLAGLTLAMSLLPEEFPVVLTIFLALGAWRLSRRGVLTRRVPVIETLGSATVLCVDKTGTLTQNHMAIRRLWTPGRACEVAGQLPELAEGCREVVSWGILASQTDPFDPMEKAFHELGAGALREAAPGPGWKLEREYPLTPGLLAMTRVWRAPGRDELTLAAKGAPEAIAGMCGLSSEATAAMLAEVGRMAADGLRVLGVARGERLGGDLPADQHDLGLEYLGLVGLADPLRASVPAAVAECATAGIRIIMITGDHAVTALSIARQAGISPADHAVTGPEMAKMSDEELRERAATTNVFARVVPEQKLRLVQALKARGEIVAMTGDGVNDAPALKAAHIGIAMGGRGTDVAREAASLVLLDDDFSSIVAAVRMGRRIFDHIRKAVAYTVAIHVPIAGLSLLPIVLNWPLILTPVHVMFLELIIDPACSLVFEAEEENPELMRRPPRPTKEPLIGRSVFWIAIAQGAMVLAPVLAVFGVALHRGQGELDARSLCFTTLIVANLGLIFVNRSWSRSSLTSLKSRNRPLWWVVGGTVALLVSVLYVPSVQRLFGFTVLHPGDLMLTLIVGGSSVLWFELFKRVRTRRRSRA